MKDHGGSLTGLLNFMDETRQRDIRADPVRTREHVEEIQRWIKRTKNIPVRVGGIEQAVATISGALKSAGEDIRRVDNTARTVNRRVTEVNGTLDTMRGSLDEANRARQALQMERQKVESAIRKDPEACGLYLQMAKEMAQRTEAEVQSLQDREKTAYTTLQGMQADLEGVQKQMAKFAATGTPDSLGCGVPEVKVDLGPLSEGMTTLQQRVRTVEDTVRSMPYEILLKRLEQLEDYRQQSELREAEKASDHRDLRRSIQEMDRKQKDVHKRINQMEDAMQTKGCGPTTTPSALQPEMESLNTKVHKLHNGVAAHATAIKELNGQVQGILMDDANLEEAIQVAQAAEKAYDIAMQEKKTMAGMDNRVTALESWKTSWDEWEASQGETDKDHTGTARSSSTSRVEETAQKPTGPTTGKDEPERTSDNTEKEATKKDKGKSHKGKSTDAPGGGGAGDDDGHHADSEDSDEDDADDDMPNLSDGSSDDEVGKPKKKKERNFYSSDEDGDEAKRPDWNRLTRARIQHQLPKQMRDREADYKQWNEKSSGTELIEQLLTKVAGATNKADAALTGGRSIPVMTSWDAEGFSVWKPKWLNFAETVEAGLIPKWDEMMWHAVPEGHKKPLKDLVGDKRGANKDKSTTPTAKELWDYMVGRWEKVYAGAFYGNWKDVKPAKTGNEMQLADWDEYIPKLRDAVHRSETKVRHEEVIKEFRQHIVVWIQNKVDTKMAQWKENRREFWISGLQDDTLSVDKLQQWFTEKKKVKV